jgi:cytochrome P450
MTNASATLEDEFFASPAERREDPYPYYERLRALPEGIGRSTTLGIWHTATHAHIRSLLVDPRLSTNPKFASGNAAGAPAQLSPARSQENVLLFMDPPDHTRIRRLASKAFTPRAVRSLEDDIVQIAHELLDEIGVGPGSGPFDLAADYARLLPLAVICRMFAIPDIDRTNFLRWSDDLAHALEPIETPEAIETTLRSYLEFAEYFDDLAAGRRAELGDDLFSALLAAEADGDRLSAEELRSLFTLLFIAGHETTGNLIGNGTLNLLRNPDQLARLRAEPDLIAPAVDELLRFDSSVQLTGRIAKEPVEIEGTDVRLEAGDEIICYLGGRRLITEEFGPDADRRDVTRDARNHLAFGGGIHYCMGASLARLEATVAFRVLLERCPSLELAEDDPPHRDQVVLRGLERLPLISA